MTKLAIGRPIKVKPIRSARDLIRRHLREEGMTIAQLAAHWKITPKACYTIMYGRRPLGAARCKAVIQALKLDEFDASELYLLAAREEGYEIVVCTRCTQG